METTLTKEETLRRLHELYTPSLASPSVPASPQASRRSKLRQKPRLLSPTALSNCSLHPVRPRFFVESKLAGTESLKRESEKKRRDLPNSKLHSRPVDCMHAFGHYKNSRQARDSLPTSLSVSGAQTAQNTNSNNISGAIAGAAFATSRPRIYPRE